MNVMEDNEYDTIGKRRNLLLTTRSPGSFQRKLGGAPYGKEVIYTWSMKTGAQLFEGRLALNLGLNLTLVSFSCAQKHFLG